MNIKVVPNPDQKGWEENGTTTDGTPIYKWEAGGVSGNGSSTGAGMVISPTPPTEKVTGMQWLNSTTAEVFIWDEDKWVEMPAGSGGSSGGVDGLWTDNGDTSISYNDGNVGIGTDNPKSTLHVDGSYISLTRDGTYGYLEPLSTSLQIGTAPSSTANQLTLATKGQERMVIDADGNVGIGAADPSIYADRLRNLVVSSSSNTGITIASGPSNRASIQFAEEGAAGLAGGLIDYYNDQDKMVFLTAGQEQMVIDASGNVGIGTSTPTIYGSGYGILTVNGSTAGLISFQNNDVAVAEQYYDSVTNQLRFQTNTDDGAIAFRSGPAVSDAVMTIDASGRVDITGSLYVNGTPKIGTVDMIKAFSKLRDAVKDEETVESLKESITNCIGGLIEEWEAMQSPATQEAGE